MGQLVNVLEQKFWGMTSLNVLILTFVCRYTDFWILLSSWKNAILLWVIHSLINPQNYLISGRQYSLSMSPWKHQNQGVWKENIGHEVYEFIWSYDLCWLTTFSFGRVRSSDLRFSGNYLLLGCKLIWILFFEGFLRWSSKACFLCRIKRASRRHRRKYTRLVNNYLFSHDFLLFSKRKICDKWISLLQVFPVVSKLYLSTLCVE